MSTGWEAFCAAYKTEICRYRSHCRDRERCYFAHSGDEMREKTCLQYYFNSRCNRRDCNWRHSKNLPEVPGEVRDEFLKNRRRENKRKRSRSPSPVRLQMVPRWEVDKIVEGYEAQIASLKAELQKQITLNSMLGVMLRAAQPPQQIVAPPPQVDASYIGSLLAGFTKAAK